MLQFVTYLRIGLGLGLLALSSAALADSERRWPLCRLETLEWSAEEPAGAVRGLAALAALGGEPLPGVTEYGLEIAGVQVPATCRRRHFSEQREQALSIVLAVEKSATTKPYLAALIPAITTWLRQLPPLSQVLLLPFDDAPESGASFGSARAAETNLSRLVPSDELEVALLTTLRAARRLLVAAPIPLGTHRAARRVVIVFGSGLDRIMTPRRFVEVGEELAHDAIVAFPIALAPPEAQLQLLGLAELAWRTHGTFRWVRSHEDPELAAELDEQLDTLHQELANTDVLSFSGPELLRLVQRSYEKTGKAPLVTLLCDGRSAAPRVLTGTWRRHTRPPHKWWLLAVVCALGGAVAWLWFAHLRR